jgi:segregation and condensation protein A
MLQVYDDQSRPPPLCTSLKEDAPFAVVQGIPFTEPLRDLYIPPDALEVFLEAFEGPLDLLLYLIRRQNLDIRDIPIAEITRQYMAYMDWLEVVSDLSEEGSPLAEPQENKGSDEMACDAGQAASEAPREGHAGPAVSPQQYGEEDPQIGRRFELAGEYLVMAATLAEIKSRMLLAGDEEQVPAEDPRRELVHRLQEYELFKLAAQNLDQLPQVGRDEFLTSAAIAEAPSNKVYLPVDLKDLLFAFKDVMDRAALFSSHQVRREPLSVQERMERVLRMVEKGEVVDFSALFCTQEGRRGVVVSLLAILELIKESLLELVQITPFGPIYVKAAG